PPPPGPDATDAERMAALPRVAAVGYCQSCHVEREFCDGCHGLQIPHPEEYLEIHPEDGRARPRVCEPCHASRPGGDFCNECHHEVVIEPGQSWALELHIPPVREAGAEACFECHSPTFCAECHVRGYIAP
ncbi:MAG TPA: hypothetical protein VFH17_05545, partial [Coriobacteriia bacterium]|nr:hypothetical protein [Coriobacteriia bacterium]